MRTKPSLTLADVKKMLAACEAKAGENKWAVAISIVDDGGYLLGFTLLAAMLALIRPPERDRLPLSSSALPSAEGSPHSPYSRLPWIPNS